MQIIDKAYVAEFPLKWADLHYYPGSKGSKIEIYLKDQTDELEGLIYLFHVLFEDVKNRIFIHSKSWWDYCLEVWDLEKDEYNYSLEDKSPETRAYLSMLLESNIEKDYSGSCKCNDFNTFLPIVLKPVICHAAPYSPIFYSEQYDFFFYFHHTGSIGLYYQNHNEKIRQIIDKANAAFEVIFY